MAITKSRLKIVSGFILLATGLWVAFTPILMGETTQMKKPVPRQGFIAPDFSLATMDGDSIRLADLRGQAVIINFWTSWCPPCKAEMPTIQKVYEDYHSKGLEVLAVHVTSQDDIQKARAFVQEQRLTFPILLDSEGQISEKYQMRALPSTFFVGRDGVVQKVVIGGPMSAALLRSQIELLLKEQ